MVGKTRSALLTTGRNLASFRFDTVGRTYAQPNKKNQVVYRLRSRSESAFQLSRLRLFKGSIL